MTCIQTTAAIILWWLSKYMNGSPGRRHSSAGDWWQEDSSQSRCQLSTFVLYRIVSSRVLGTSQERSSSERPHGKITAYQLRCKKHNMTYRAVMHLRRLLGGDFGDDGHAHVAVVSLRGAGSQPQPGGAALEAISGAHASPVLGAKRRHAAGCLVRSRGVR